jgi:HSP20 family protein
MLKGSYMDITNGIFTRSFTLPDNVDETKVTASFKDGMLNIQIQKARVAKQKTIEVKVG